MAAVAIHEATDLSTAVCGWAGVGGIAAAGDMDVCACVAVCGAGLKPEPRARVRPTRHAAARGITEVRSNIRAAAWAAGPSGTLTPLRFGRHAKGKEAEASSAIHIGPRRTS